jgi:hypothetical protein
MCYAILRVSYKNGTEPVTLREVNSPAELDNVIKELMEKSGVQKVTSFFPHETTELVSEWKTILHNLEEDLP